MAFPLKILTEKKIKVYFSSQTSFLTLIISTIPLLHRDTSIINNNQFSWLIL
ncbi:hypothetical protein DR66_3979 [Delftia acidovorans]|nr:hypothetical protein DR66_3979 [Delftia acidovorans]